jgi:hypothetical protein
MAWVVILATGCAERRTVYVPTYQRPAVVYPGQPVYAYPPQASTQAPPPPLVSQSPTAENQGAVPPPNGSDVVSSGANPNAAYQGAPSSGQVVVAQPPPAPQVEVVPVAPGPDYVWAPGYWSWNGGWIWVGGAWTLRPRPYAVWVGPRWVHYGRGYRWERGHWR